MPRVWPAAILLVVAACTNPSAASDDQSTSESTGESTGDSGEDSTETGDQGCAEPEPLADPAPWDEIRCIENVNLPLAECYARLGSTWTLVFPPGYVNDLKLNFGFAEINVWPSNYCEPDSGLGTWELVRCLEGSGTQCFGRLGPAWAQARPMCFVDDAIGPNNPEIDPWPDAFCDGTPPAVRRPAVRCLDGEEIRCYQRHGDTWADLVYPDCHVDSLIDTGEWTEVEPWPPPPCFDPSDPGGR